MSNKLKYYPERNGEPVEFASNIVRIELPNGTEFILQFDPKMQGLSLQKAWAENGDTSITILPLVSNDILIK